jgi:hypothetical protein
MLGQKERDQLELFISGSLGQLIPDEYVLARVDRVLDLSWLKREIADCYCLDDGRPGIDPEAAVRLMLAGLLIGIVHDRKLMREAQVNIAIRWFIGYGLHEKLPHHSSLTRIRQRWGGSGVLERRGIDALAEPIRSPVPLRRFRYDAKNAGSPYRPLLQRPHDAPLPGRVRKNSAAISSEVISRTPFNPRSLRCLRNALQPVLSSFAPSQMPRISR